MMGARSPIPPVRFKEVRTPVLIVVGSKDDAIGDPKPLAEMIPGARLLMLEGRHHLNAPSDQRYKDAVLEFFAAAPR
ncbi:MAG: alpha/beta fold hydrolase [Candidatus Binataceae bacterium]